MPLLYCDTCPLPVAVAFLSLLVTTFTGFEMLHVQASSNAPHCYSTLSLFCIHDDCFQEKINKMSLQNVSIVLSPTMRISHRVLNVLFMHSDDLFAKVKITR